MEKVKKYLELEHEAGKERFSGNKEQANKKLEEAKELLDSFTMEELIILQKQTPNIYGRMALQKKIDSLK